ncbi:MAG: 50S ribosomal protein L24 [Dehalococcoidia bacterium]|nr:50S ribosomal protein L24 [Dehalococcoidia bacterium]
MADRIKAGDLVQVMVGSESKDRGKQGRVLAVDREKRKVRVQGIRMQKRHLKPGTRASARTGGIIEQEGYIDLSNVMLVDPSDSKPSRIRIEDRDGQRMRVFVRSGEPVPEPQKG